MSLSNDLNRLINAGKTAFSMRSEARLSRRNFALFVTFILLDKGLYFGIC